MTDQLEDRQQRRQISSSHPLQTIPVTTKPRWWNLEKCSINSFLLDNGALYHVANGTAMTEYLLSLYFWPHSKSNHSVSAIGVLMVFFGQRKSHKLVTNGVYAWFRHPAYAGFFYWALGTQLVLQNPLSFVLFSILLWRFFYYRTREEERDLIAFFGDEYIQYRRRVGTRLPFIP
ncbi:hypothetical protein APHAL10511_001936 [Amanita phalloides]|nr:hypothetical protein APHAL10511_001936 [Amanita phalloides]